MASTRNPYSNLYFAPNVDWAHVDPSLLQKINAAAKARGQVVDIISGYRSPSYNQKVGGAQGSLHTQGRAVDAYIDGKPIGEVWGQEVFQNLGLRSGNQPNFFKGKPDPEHVDLGFSGGSQPSQTPVTSYDTSGQQSQQQSQQASPPLSSTIASDIASDPGIGPAVGPNVNIGRDMTSAPIAPAQLPPRFETWQMLSQLPGASPDTMKMTQLASLESNGNG